MEQNAANYIIKGKAVLGIEFGSSRIKAVLLGADRQPIASGIYDWENNFIDGVWTYSLEDAMVGLSGCYADLARNVQEKYGAVITSLSAIGISGMMHGYLPFDKDGRQLAPFRTWRNTITQDASEKITALFDFNIPQRWSIAHLYQAMLNGESHVKDISFLTTLAGYIHWRLTGKKAIGVNEASGMFPVDTFSCDYDKRMLGLFDKLAADLGMEWKVGQLLPEIIPAGRTAGTLTEEGARLLDPSGTLQAGIPLCAPEGDAGTGMIATNSIAPGTGNLSAGTSIFVTITMDQALSRMHPEIDVLANPAGHPAAMVHCINGTPEIDAWINLFGDVTASLGQPADKNKLYEAFYTAALKGSEDCGGLTAFNFLAGEHIIDLPEGRPMLIRRPDSEFSFANLARVILFSTLGSVRIGMNILTQQEGVLLKELLGHGGLYKTTDAGQRITAAALNVPVRIRSGASEGGAWGIALLAAYMQDNNGESLVDYLNGGVFAADQSTLAKPDAQLAASFNSYMERYGAGLSAQRAAIEHL